MYIFFFTEVCYIGILINTIVNAIFKKAIMYLFPIEI